MKAKLKVLIVEDELMIADMAEELLVAEGYEVCGIARTVEEAVELGIYHKPNLALVDFRLADGGLGTEVGTRLRAVGTVGVLFVTGNDTHIALKDADGDACLVKPYRSDELLSSLKTVAEIVANGVATPPFSKGFRLLRRAYVRPAEMTHG
jgi:DNA-binding response OmpR family regulator